MIIGVASVDHRTAAESATGREEWGPTGWARLGQWVPYWREHHTVVVGMLWNQDDHLAIEVVGADGERGLIAPDVVYLQAFQRDLSPLLRRARASGQVVVQDVDDWYWGLDARHRGWEQARRAEQAYAANLAETDLVIASTPYLAARLAERFAGEIVVIGNYVDTGRFAPVGHDVERPTIGWAGATDFRVGDLAELKGVLGQFTAAADFQHSGHLDGAPTFAEQVGLATEAVRRVERRPPADYPGLLDFHIGLVPLRSNPFNEAKSELKGLEYAAAGIPFVASPTGVYRQLHAAWGDCVRIAKRPADWVKHLRRLLDRAAREDAAEELRKRVLERDLAQGAHLHLEVFAALDHR